MAAVFRAFRPPRALSMRRNASTVVVLPGPAPAEVLAAVGRSMNVALIRPKEPADDDGDGLEAAAGALQQAGRSTSAYALVPADPLAALAASWRAMWDVSRPEGPAGFEAEALKALTAWRSGRFELPDYYLVLGPGPAGPAGPAGPPVPRPATRGRTSTSARCGPPGRNGWPWWPRPSPPSRPPASCRPSAPCRTARGGRAWTR